jgi:hypothetical protein
MLEFSYIKMDKKELFKNNFIIEYLDLSFSNKE